jgi:hypothetical protein
MHPMSLCELIAPARRVAVVGLAKNTGKTETLGAILRELEELGRTVGVTSVGRDGEARDVIDGRIEKPLIRLATGSLVATTDALLRASGLPHRVVRETGVRTPLGRVLVARLAQGGAIEVAGPSTAQDVRVVTDVMLDSGAEQVLIDGAIDRRAASSPAVCDGLVMCTGAVLHEEIERVVEQTHEAVELMCLPRLENESVRALALSRLESLLVDSAGGGAVALPARFGLISSAHGISALLGDHPSGDHLIVRGAMSESFLRELLTAIQGRTLKVVVEDSTKVFLGERRCAWYRRRGLSLRVLQPIHLCVVTVNPVAPRSHSFDSFRLRAMLGDELGDVAVVDVRHASGRRSV